MLARNLLLNLIGQIAPLLAAVVAIPILIQEMGVERFGVLTIAWMVIGYFSVFDLGLGRAMTRVVAAKLGLQSHAAIPGVVWTALSLMFALSLVAGATIALLADWLVGTVLKVPSQFAAETQLAFYLLGASVPAVILTTGLRGILEAYGRFDYTNLIRVPMGLWTFLGPLLVLPFSARLDHVVMVLVAGRIVTTVLHIPLVLRAAPKAFSARTFDAGQARALFAFGGWMTVSNIISPAMVYMDRFFIGAILGVGMVAYYTTPYEVVFKLNFFPEAVFGVLFPLMSARLADQEQGPDHLYSLGNKLMAAVMFPLTFFLVLGAHDILTIWLGAKFAQESTFVMQILAIGLCINSFSKVAFNLLQAKGRADITATLHIIELPIYLGALWLLAHRYGITGAAAAWALRMVLDLALLSWASCSVVGLSMSSMRKTAILVSSSLVLFAVALSLEALPEKIGMLLLGVAIYLGGLWTVVMEASDRVAVKRIVLASPVGRMVSGEPTR